MFFYNSVQIGLFSVLDVFLVYNNFLDVLPIAYS